MPWGDAKKQMSNDSSTFSFYKKLIELRKKYPHAFEDPSSNKTNSGIYRNEINDFRQLQEAKRKEKEPKSKNWVGTLPADKHKQIIRNPDKKAAQKAATKYILTGE